MTDLQLKFNLRVEVGDNEIDSCIYALVITNRLWKQAVTLFSSCFWRTSLWWWCKHHVKTIAKIHSDISGVLQMLCNLPLSTALAVAWNEPHRFLFSYSFETKCVNVAVIYVLYALKLKLWLRSNPVSKYLLLRKWDHRHSIAATGFILSIYLWWQNTHVCDGLFTIIWNLSIFINDFKYLTERKEKQFCQVGLVRSVVRSVHSLKVLQLSSEVNCYPTPQLP